MSNLPDQTDRIRRPDRLNVPLAAAAVVAAGTTALHVFGGGPAIAQPILDSALDETVRLTFFVVWHAVTMVLGFSAIGLGMAALPSHRDATGAMVVFISAVWIAFGLLFLAVAAANGGGAQRFFVDLGQWILLIPVGVLGLWGLRQRAAPDAPRLDEANDESFNREAYALAR